MKVLEGTQLICHAKKEPHFPTLRCSFAATITFVTEPNEERKFDDGVRRKFHTRKKEGAPAVLSRYSI